MLAVNLLGQFEVLHDGDRVAIPTRSAQSLLAYLALNAGRSQRREKLAGLLWPDSTEENARSNLRHELWRLRKALDGDHTHFTNNDLSITFEPQCEFRLDTCRLESVSADSTSIAELAETLDLYRGELLPGFYDEWIGAERERLYAVFEARIARLLELLDAEGRWPEIQEWGLRWISFGGWPEPAYRALILAYAQSGDLSKAAAIYARLSQGMLKDLKVRPSEQTQALYRRIKSGARLEIAVPTAAHARSAAGLPASNPSDLAAPATLKHSGLPLSRRTNLPRPLTSFIGREKEIRQVKQLTSASRLVTITGPGGVGKTRLAIQAGMALAPQFEDGAWWVDLASLAGSEAAPGEEDTAGIELVALAVCRGLRVPEATDRPLLDGLVDALRDKELLLVLDNCEHLIAACAALSERLLSECPGLAVLATSREPLGVPGEKAWTAPSLSLPAGERPDLDSVRASESGDLFITRAGDALPGFQPAEADASAIAQICLRLDGIPLAIELAAARVGLLSIHEIAARLDRIFALLSDGRRTALPRHRTLRAAIEWSYDLLGEDERRIFRRLAIFPSGFTLEAAEAVVTADDLPRDEVLPLIGRLVSKSLLTVERGASDSRPTRYRFLDTVRSFGRLQLNEASETEVTRRRTIAYFVDLTKAAEKSLLTAEQVYWIRLLLDEHDNLHAAIEWSIESDQPENALCMIADMLWFWFRSGSNRECRDLVLRALAAPGAERAVVPYARCLINAGYVHCLLGDAATGRAALEKAVDILRRVEDPGNLAWALQFLGLALVYSQDYDMADAAFREGLEISRRLPIGDNNVVFFWGDAYVLRGDISRARRTYADSVRYLREIGNLSFMAYPLRQLGYLDLHEGRLDEAWEHMRESLEGNVQMRDEPGVTASLAGLAALALRLDKPRFAVGLTGAIERRLEAFSVNLLHLDRAEYNQLTARLQSRLEPEAFNAAFAEGWEMSDAQVVHLGEQVFAREDF